MATKEAHSKANIAYNKRQDNIMIRPSKEQGAKIRTAAADENMSVQAYILQTLYVRIGIEAGGVVENSESGNESAGSSSYSISPAQETVLDDIFKVIVQRTPADERERLKEEVAALFQKAIDKADKE